jgi:lysyl-tRNA synthetase, class II
VVRALREQLEQRGFTEVETPSLWPQTGGAAARPFETHANALGLPMRLRISPELFLKVPCASYCHTG